MIGNCNPLNIRYVKRNNWKGQIGSTRGFCDFVSVGFCIRAFAILVLRSYKKRGVVTISQIINRYAPPTENDTDKYVYNVCQKLACLPFDVISDVHMMSRFVCAVARFESGIILSEPHVYYILLNFGFGNSKYYV